MKNVPLGGKTALVTGASVGIGLACARALAAEGANVIVVARRLKLVQALAEELAAEFGVKALAAKLDVCDRQAVEKFIGSLTEPFNRIELLVNNAGLARGLEPIDQGSPEDWNEMIDTNVKGLLWVTKAVIPGMLRAGCGQVITIGSFAGHETYPGGSVYCATKHAVRSITDGLRIDYYDTPLRFTLISPSLIETEFSLVRFHGDQKKAKGPYRGITPLTSEDVADAVVYAATRPVHLNINDIIMMPISQGTTNRVHRKDK